MATEEKEKLSPVETIKTESKYLRGEIAQELIDGNDHFGKDSVHLLKNHGLYQQDDRDERAGRSIGRSEERQVVHLHGAHQDSGRKADQQPVAG